MSQQIPVGTVLGGRYEITAQIIVTAETDMILDGMDQILSRKVSVVVASPARSNLLENNSRVLNESNPYSFQMLDMGITPEGSKYLITSYTAPSVLLDALLTEQRSLSDVYDDEAALGTEIFGATVPTQPAAMEVIGAIKSWDGNPIQPEMGGGMYPGGDLYDDDEDDEDDGRRGTWVIVLAAVLLLLIVAGAVLISLTGIGSSKTAEPKPAKSTSASASASEGGESPSPTPSPETTSNAPAKIATVARLVPNNPTFMSETDANLPKLSDNNPATVWMSYGFGSGKLAVPFALSAKLQTPTVVSKVTMQQNTGTGGAYTVYVNNQNSLNGATEVGKGTFNGKDAVVELDTSKQSADKGGYVIIQFTEAPKLSQPISIYPYGLRLAELKAE